MINPTPAKDAQPENAGYAHDYRTFHRDGRVVYGCIADSYTADLVMYLAGNQFMTIEELVGDFLQCHPDIATVYVETIPPGQILQEHILRQGAVNGLPTCQTPDIYGSVNIAHLAALKDAALMSEYCVYMHNKLALMVAAGNPRRIAGPADLGRDDLVQVHPNPITEGIFKFYAVPMLKQLGLFEKVTGGRECVDAWAVAGKTWFTDRHHREIPYWIEQGRADVGIVWATEIIEARRAGRALDGVEIPYPLNQQQHINYMLGPLNGARNLANARRYISYLNTPAAQSILESYGFVGASKEELELRPL